MANKNNETEIPIKDDIQIESLKDLGGETNKNIPKSKKALTRTMIVKNKVENFSLDDLGTIEKAKKHRSANRPLHKIGEFTEYVNFCKCCDLPCEEKGIIEPFHFCENIDEFSECGLGITLYFYFFRFMTLIVFMGLVILSISMIIFNYQYSDGIIEVCDIYYNNHTNGALDYCEGFIKNPTNDTNMLKRFDRWILRLSSDNIKKYRLLPDEQLKPNYNDNNNINDVIVNYSLLNFFYLITCFIINILFIILIKAQAQKARILNLSIRDYTVLITEAKPILYDYNEYQRKIRPGFFQGSQIEVENGKEFKTYVNDYIRGHEKFRDFEIYNINLCYDLDEYIGFRDDYEECKRKIFQVEHNKRNIELNEKNKLTNDNRLYYNFYLFEYGLYWFDCCYTKGLPLIALKKQKLDLEQQLKSEERNITDYITEKNFTGYMLVAFNKIEDKENFLAEYPHDFFYMVLFFLQNLKYYICCCFINKEERKYFKRIKGIDAYDPPEPEDIIWENFVFTERQRRIRTILIFIVCLGIIVISLVIVLLLTFLQDYYNDIDKEVDNKNIFIKYLVSLAIVVVISIINTIFQLILEKLTYRERQISRSNYILSLSIKLTIFTFLNSAIVPLLSKYFVLHITEGKRKYDENPKYERRREGDFLLVNDLLITFISNAIVTPILWSFDFSYILRRIQQYCIERRENPDKNHYMTQRDLNKLYEYPDMKLAYKYSYIVKTTAMCFFFMPIFPLGFFFATIGFIFGYFLEKFNFTHLYKRPEMLDEIITKAYANHFIIILFIGGVGDYFFLHDAFDTKNWALINIIVFGVLIIVPYTNFINCNFVGIDKSQYLNYPLSKVFFTFYNDYQRQNPLTKRMGLLYYLSELKKFGYLSDYAYGIAQDNIDQLNIMEIYYGISRGIIPITNQSIISNVNNASLNNVSLISTGNLVKSVLGRGIFKSTIVRPEIKDNPEMKKMKKQFFESQIYNLFGKGMENMGLKENEIKNGSIDELVKGGEENDIEAKAQLNGNNPLEINTGLGSLPITQTIYKKERNLDILSSTNINVE